MELSVVEIGKSIRLVRGLQVVLDCDLAKFYQTQTKVLNQAVRRNSDRFPEDFMILLTQQEHTAMHLRTNEDQKSENRGGRRNLPYGFTQEGVSMLSGVLNSERAVQVNILLMRAFVQLRQVSETHLDLAKRFDEFERRCNEQFKNMVETIRRPSGQISDQPIRLVNPESISKMQSLGAMLGIQNDQGFFGNRPRLKLEMIQNAVVQYYEISIAELKSSSRTASVAVPRQVCMYLIKKYLKLSYECIGAAFGGKGHTTVLHAYKKIEKEIGTNAKITEAVELIQSLLAAKGFKN